MNETYVSNLLLEVFDSLSPQLQAGARWMLDNPEDVALLSMREQAKRADVPPATLVRLARRLGFEGYEQLRAISASALRGRADHFAARAHELQKRRRLDGDAALISDVLAGAGSHLKQLGDPETLTVIARAADLIVQSARVFCVGARSSFAGAFLGAYLLSMIGEETVLADGAGAIGLDRLRDMRAGDAMLALTVSPYTRLTVEATAFARARGVRVIAITDSQVSPIARDAAVCILVPTSTPSFLQTVAPAIIALECLAALVAAKRGPRAIEAIAETESHLSRFGSYVIEKPTRARMP